MSLGYLVSESKEKSMNDGDMPNEKATTGHIWGHLNIKLCGI